MDGVKEFVIIEEQAGNLAIKMRKESQPLNTSFTTEENLLFQSKLCRGQTIGWISASHPLFTSNELYKQGQTDVAGY